MSVGQLLMIALLASRDGAGRLALGLRLDRHRASGAAAADARAAGRVRRAAGEAPRESLSLREAARTRQFWLLLAIYAICGLDDFFVTTHVAAFAQDRGLDAMSPPVNLLALMGLTGLAGVIASGLASDRFGPIVADGRRLRGAHRGVRLDRASTSRRCRSRCSRWCSARRSWSLRRSPCVFVRESFGTRNLGALAGLITMVHQIFGGVGAYAGAAIFDATGGYDAAFVVHADLGRGGPRAHADAGAPR